MTRPLFDRASVEVRLGPKLAEGGEGSVHELAAYPGFVAKLYHQAPDADKAKKLAAMVAGKTKRLCAHAAWPVELLAAERGGPVLGLVLPRVSGFHDLHLLYGPRSRLATFPLAGWQHLVRAAANLARAFAVVHEHGHVLGDVNDKVALVSSQALVKLIDCDGFQIRHGQGVFTCDVGVPSHQPPELQGVASYRGLVRSANHDAFGLAVLVFQLLFLARHPFSGSYAEGDLPLERAIREHRFVYGAQAKERGMQPPPCALELTALSPELVTLFERAFAPAGERNGRPRAAEWAAALERFAASLRPCRTNPLHAYRAGTRCPFCVLERRSGTALFHLPIQTADRAGKRGTFVVQVPVLWREIAAVTPPPPAPSEPAGLAQRSATARAALTGERRARLRAAGIALAGLALLPWSGLASGAVLLVSGALFARGVRAAGARQLVEFEKRWRRAAGADEFAEAARELEQARRELEGLDLRHRKELAELEARRRELQREAWLDRFPLADAGLVGLSRSAVSVLASNGIETARDVSAQALRRVPALGPAVLKALLAWRRRHERAFRFDASRGLEPEALATLEKALQRRRAELVQALADGPARLRNAARQLEMRRAALAREGQELLGAERAA
jgi:DNA-binding helix-hairpin-helix protein with protein kinase domain